MSESRGSSGRCSNSVVTKVIKCYIGINWCLGIDLVESRAFILVFDVVCLLEPLWNDRVEDNGNIKALANFGQSGYRLESMSSRSSSSSSGCGDVEVILCLGLANKQSEKNKFPKDSFWFRIKRVELSSSCCLSYSKKRYTHASQSEDAYLIRTSSSFYVV